MTKIKITKKTLELLYQVQGALMILELKRLDADVIIQRALNNYYALIETDAEVKFDKTFPNMFDELKNRSLLNR